MKTIKIIDLLNKNANGEEVPKKIKYNIFELKRTMSNIWLRMYVDEEGMFFPEYYSGLTLNDTVEILEDEKKIPENNFNFIYEVDDEKINTNFENIKSTLKNIIDYLESKGE